jgi:hypothetical protein
MFGYRNASNCASLLIRPKYFVFPLNPLSGAGRLSSARSALFGRRSRSRARQLTFFIHGHAARISLCDRRIFV